ncbi:hypothetical protein PV08_00389 [Exophiala spinifera]|uniref:Uncharacterized protein n=1 Tax=Exophiala spinifera TaxID=91928 RepID=A0A0D2C8B7_9EURO|nr:uncharacterized protein PV08_00389 [Exophiala spinifera]KIW19814.1 hypothetical protein PV08_00389 [Exophiala spinifera]
MTLVFALGSNGYGQLGTGHREDSAAAQRCLFEGPPQVEETPCSSGRSDGDGDADTTTSIESGTGNRSGTGTENDDATTTTVTMQVKKIVAGGNHTLLLTLDGRIFAAGKPVGEFERDSDEEEQEEDQGQPTPPPPSPPPRPRQPSTRTPSTVFRECRTDFLAGATTETQTEAEATGPKRNTKCYISDVAATWDASFFVVDRKSVYVLGTGSKGELGLDHDVHETRRPRKVFDVGHQDDDDGNGSISFTTVEAATTTITTTAAEADILTIAASMSHVVVLLSDGRCFGWGACRKGQLGDKFRVDKALWRPTRIDKKDSSSLLPFRPDGVVLGREYTAFFRCGKPLLVWGERKDFLHEGQQALNHTLHKGDIVVSGWSSLHILSCSPSSSPTVMSSGKNHRGQLAPDKLPSITALAAGSEHCVAVTTTQDVIAWGWSEHGNCGAEVDRKGNVAGRWNVISLPPLSSKYRVTAVAGGCATTFVICEKTRP